MAGQLLNITRSIVTLTGNANLNSWQAGKDALDVVGYAGVRFDFGLKVYVLQGVTSPDVTVKLYTSMYNDDNDGTWALLGSFAQVTTSNTSKTLSVTSGVLRYVRWKIEYTDMTLVSFEVLGVAW
jgi:hypothetical protein